MAVKRYNGTSWDTVAGLGAQGAAATSSSITTWVKTAAGGETSLTGSSDSSTTLAYTPGQEQFFINGVLQVRGSDYTATNGTSITGLTALTAGDIATVTTVNAFSVTGAVPLSTVTANGDLIVGTSSGAVGRLGIGSTDQVLKVSGGVPTWATPSSGTTFVGASIRNDSGISVDSSTTTTMPFPQETFDTSAFHDSTNNSRFTVPSGKAGYYQINYTVLYQGYSSSHSVRLVYFKNGSQICLYKDACVGGVGEQNFFFSRTVNLAEGDYIELKLWQDSGISRMFYVDGNQGQAVMTYLGA
jgi:hypothetical protein